MFRKRGEKHYVSIPSTRGEGLTVIGGISTDGEFNYIIRPTTNSENVLDYLKFVSHSMDLEGAVVLMDNHAAHHSNVVKQFCDEQKLFRLF